MDGRHVPLHPILSPLALAIPPTLPTRFLNIFFGHGPHHVPKLARVPMAHARVWDSLAYVCLRAVDGTCHVINGT